MVQLISDRPRPKTIAKSAFTALALVGAAAVAAGGAAATGSAPEFSAPRDAGLMAEPADREASGLAASRRDTNLLWVLSDSGNEPVLHGLDRAGNRRGRLRLTGVANIDWEDLAAFELDGKAWLLIADCGDNSGGRRDSVLHVVEEPDPATLVPDGERSVRPAYSIHFIFEDGARDCEAVAVDPEERAVYLLTKRDLPARLYRLPLQEAGARLPAAARLVGRVPHLPQPALLQRAIKAPLFAYRGEPTGMDFSPDGRLAAVLTYGDLLLFPRAVGEFWAAALARPPTELPSHRLPQAEAACFTRDGRSVFVCSEETMRWIRYDRRE